MNTRIGISNRHVHLTREDVNILFGNNYELTKRNDLDQPGQYAANETVTLKTAKNPIKSILSQSNNLWQLLLKYQDRDFRAI